MSKPQNIHISAALITDENGRCLLVRKKGSTFFIQPGGKLEPGETAEEALVRELQEELNLSIRIESLNPLGRFTDIAINEPEHNLFADVFKIDFLPSTDVVPAAEIEEVIWLRPEDAKTVELAPLTANQLIPLVTMKTI